LLPERIQIIDMTLRDGSHSFDHQYTPAQMAAISKGLDEAGVDYIEIGHGDGLGASSLQYGLSAATDAEYLQAVSAVVERAKIGVLLLPGIGLKEDLEMAKGYGVRAAKIACLVTEVDIGQQHIELAKSLGLEAIGFMMMSHLIEPEQVAIKAKLFADYGADIVYVVDSAGALLPADVKARITRTRELVNIPVGFHAHNNLGCAVGNALAAVEAGATYIDVALCGLGAGAGNAQSEAVVAALMKMGYKTGVDLYKISDVAQDIARPMLRRPQEIDRAALMLGYSGVYSSFLLHTYRAAEKFGVDARDILVELGRRKTVGGQEDMIVDVAFELSQKP